MRKDIQDWITELRSGEYKQVRGALEYNGGYCCLGVYCKVKGVNYKPAWKDLDGEYGVTEDNFEVYELLRETIPSQIVDNGISMNDRGRSFADIADMIEKYYTEEESNA